MARIDAGFGEAVFLACTGASRSALLIDGAGHTVLSPEQLDRCDVVCWNRGGTMRAAWVALDAPGAAAMILGHSMSSDGVPPEVTTNALRWLVDRGSTRGVRLFEILLETRAGGTARTGALVAAGFRRLTQLVYLQGPVAAPHVAGAASLTWRSYSLDAEDDFLKALESSYLQSLDCPELTGLRSTAEALAGHRAAGPFDPGLWWVARRDGAPVGVLLGSRLPDLPAVEIVYLGVAQPARGTGVADALMARAARLARSESANMLTLAVDVRNAPALRLYARWGLCEYQRRDAWIATPHQT